MSTNAPIEICIHNWHRHMRGELPGGLDSILHEDCVFLSPIVFTPQEGREITKLYLTAAGGTLGGTDGDVTDAVASNRSSWMMTTGCGLPTWPLPAAAVQISPRFTRRR